MSYFNFNKEVIVDHLPENSANCMLVRGSGYHISKEVTISLAAGSHIVNVLQLTGNVTILNQYAIITEVTTLTNLTAMYATLYDGTNSVNLTKNGAVLSGAPVGSIFMKDKIAAFEYTVSMADECRMVEETNSRSAGRPFMVTQKDGTNTYIRFHLTTTDNPVSFKIEVHMEYIPMDGGSLTFL